MATSTEELLKTLLGTMPTDREFDELLAGLQLHREHHGDPPNPNDPDDDGATQHLMRRMRLLQRTAADYRRRLNLHPPRPATERAPAAEE